MMQQLPTLWNRTTFLYGSTGAALYSTPLFLPCQNESRLLTASFPSKQPETMAALCFSDALDLVEKTHGAFPSPEVSFFRLFSDRSFRDWLALPVSRNSVSRSSWGSAFARGALFPVPFSFVWGDTISRFPHSRSVFALPAQTHSNPNERSSHAKRHQKHIHLQTSFYSAAV